ncbi:MAG: long-chain-fatty-acid--CoA ligase [Pseudomonadota bacterium]
MLVHEILEAAAARLPEKKALIEGDRSLTYREVLAQVQALAAALEDRGVGSGDRVALLFPNCIEFCLAYFAVLSLGAVVVPLNNRLAPREFEYIINDSGAETLIVGYQFWDAYGAFKNGLTTVSRVIYAGEAPVDGAEFWPELMVSGTAPRSRPDLEPDHPACIMYTSGTTGLPKGAVMSHRNIFTNARNCGVHFTYQENDVTLITVPLFHVTGLNSQLVAFFYTGGTCVILRAYNTGEMIRQAERYRVTVLVGVPTMYSLMLVNPALDQCDLSSLRMAGFGGAPMDPETIFQLQKRLGVGLYNGYGLTETSSVATTLPACDALRKAGSIGLPATWTQLRVVDHEGRDLPPDEVGELLIKGPQVVSGYWNKPEATARDITDGWLHTGDYARIDPEGFAFIVDRKKDMINRGGENVYSIEVESALLAHPKILEAAVVPRPHSIFQEVVHAFVVLNPGAEADEDEIIRFCHGRIADYKIPASVSFIDELPRNPGGKVLKARLREMVPAGDPPRRVF